MSKAFSVYPKIKLSEFTRPIAQSVLSKLKLKNLIIRKIFKLGLKKIIRQPKGPNEEIIENLIFVEKEYVKNLINSKGLKTRDGSGEMQRTPKRKLCKTFSRKKNLAGKSKEFKRRSLVKIYDFSRSSPLSEKIARLICKNGL